MIWKSIAGWVMKMLVDLWMRRDRVAEAVGQEATDEARASVLGLVESAVVEHAVIGGLAVRYEVELALVQLEDSGSPATTEVVQPVAADVMPVPTDNTPVIERETTTVASEGPVAEVREGVATDQVQPAPVPMIKAVQVPEVAPGVGDWQGGGEVVENVVPEVSAVGEKGEGAATVDVVVAGLSDEQLEEANRRFLRRVVRQTIVKRQQRFHERLGLVVSYLESNGPATKRQMVKDLGIGGSSMGKYLMRLRAEGRIVAEGESKARTFRVV